MNQPNALAHGSGLTIGWFGSVNQNWMPLLDHFLTVEILDRSSASQWLHEPSNDRLLMLGLDDRNDNRLDWLLELESSISKKLLSKSTASKRTATKRNDSKKVAQGNKSKGIDTFESMACVLGEDWAGHRRTFPLPDTLQAFYWHQWYDRVIPWVYWHGASLQTPLRIATEHSQESSLGERIRRIQSDTNRFMGWRSSDQVESILRSRIAWVIADQSSHLQQWQGLLESYGVRSVGTRLDQGACALDADLILVDFCDRSGWKAHPNGMAKKEIAKDEIFAKQRLFLRNLRQEQPKAFMVWVAPISTMSDWDRYRTLGIDAIVQRPFSLQGILCSWACWLQTQRPEIRPLMGADDR